jgi:hypothetical protein
MTALRPDVPADLSQENTRLQAELRAAEERQIATAEILRTIASTPGDAGRSLQQIAETSARLFGAPSVSLQLGNSRRTGNGDRHSASAAAQTRFAQRFRWRRSGSEDRICRARWLRRIGRFIFQISTTSPLPWPTGLGRRTPARQALAPCAAPRSGAKATRSAFSSFTATDAYQSFPGGAAHTLYQLTDSCSNYPLKAEPNIGQSREESA